MEYDEVELGKHVRVSLTGYIARVEHSNGIMKIQVRDKFLNMEHDGSHETQISIIETNNAGLLEEI